MLLRPKQTLIIALIFSLLTTALFACGETAEEADPSDSHHHLHVADIEVFESDSGDVLAHSEGESWHGALPPITVAGERLSVKVNAFDEHQEMIELDFDNHHDLRAHFADDAPELVEINHCMMRGCTIHLVPGAQTGETAIHIRVLEDGEEIYQSPPLPVLLVDPADD